MQMCESAALSADARTYSMFALDGSAATFRNSLGKCNEAKCHDNPRSSARLHSDRLLLLTDVHAATTLWYLM